jgi:hypothetical protein
MAKSKATDSIVTRVTKMKTGLLSELAGKTLELGGAVVTVDDVVAEVDAYIAQVTAARTAKTGWAVALRAQHATEATTINPRLAALELYLEGFYGPTSPTLDKFGLSPRKPVRKTVKVKAGAIEKDLATRVARHTEGPREKEAIHGTVTEPSAPAPAPVTPADAPKR